MGSATSATGFVTAIPYTVAIVGLVLISRHSDRTGERKLHVACPLAIAAVAFALSTIVSPVAAIAALAVGLFFLLGAHPRVLVDAGRAAERHRGGGRDRADQLDRQPRRLRRARTWSGS